MFVALLGLFVSSCKNNDELSISGKIENAGDIKKVLLYETDQLVDSAFLKANSFKLNTPLLNPSR